MDPPADEEDTWAFRPILDIVAVVLLGVVFAEAVGGLVAGLDLTLPRNAVGVTAGPLPNPFGATPLGERLRLATEWATAFQGVVLIASLGLVTLPRVVWDTSDDHRTTDRIARVVTVSTVVLGVVLALAGALGVMTLFWSPGEPYAGFQSPETPILIEHLVAAGLGGFLAWMAVLAKRRVLPEAG